MDWVFIGKLYDAWAGELGHGNRSMKIEEGKYGRILTVVCEVRIRGEKYTGQWGGDEESLMHAMVPPETIGREWAMRMKAEMRWMAAGSKNDEAGPA